MRIKQSDLTLACGIVAMLLLGHVITAQYPARADETGSLHKQGAGVAYGEGANERLSQMESQARSVLKQLGSAESSYASTHTPGQYAHFRDLVRGGYLMPNAAGGNLTPGYSVTFYLPPAKRGFTLLAEPTDLQLRPLLLDENQLVVVLTPTIDGDPDEGWATIRERMETSRTRYGYYMPPFSLELAAHNPPLEVRINWEATNYILQALAGSASRGYVPDDSLIYSSFLNTYLIGDVRELQTGTGE